MTQSPAEIAAAARAEARKAAQAAKKAAKPAAKPTKAKDITKSVTKSTAKKTTKAPATKTLAEVSNQAPSVEIAGCLQQAFDHFNNRLFDSKLPNVVFSFVRLKKANGHFWAKQWKRDGVTHEQHEIGLDTTRINRDEHDILATLVHEMVHLEEEVEGRGPKRVYHSKTWAAGMHRVGLKPHAVVRGVKHETKETGPSCTHSIIKGGVFDKACRELLEGGFTIPWHQIPLVKKTRGEGGEGEGEGEGEEGSSSKQGKRAKFCCPECDGAAWAKFSAKLICGDCKVPMVAEGASESGATDDDEDGDDE